jgi:hypothetical protein
MHVAESLKTRRFRACSFFFFFFLILLESSRSVSCSINATVDIQLPQSENQTDARNVGSLHVFILSVVILRPQKLMEKMGKVDLMQAM